MPRVRKMRRAPTRSRRANRGVAPTPSLGPRSRPRPQRPSRAPQRLQAQASLQRRQAARSTRQPQPQPMGRPQPLKRAPGGLSPIQERRRQAALQRRSRAAGPTSGRPPRRPGGLMGGAIGGVGRRTPPRPQPRAGASRMAQQAFRRKALRGVRMS